MENISPDAMPAGKEQQVQIMYLFMQLARQITPNEPYSQWIPAPTADGKWTFHADNGKYLSRCTNCATSTVPNLAFLNETNPAMPYAQFTFV